MTFDEAKEALEVAHALRLLATICPAGAERRQMQAEAKALESAARKVTAN